ncbi:MAG: hypothetical protein HN348_33630, partial [Proteobacteria bacterium]|nr:hypothetical protein [Pseudomonadota bacterium]
QDSGPQDRYQQPPPKAGQGLNGPTEAPEPWSGFSRGPVRPHFDGQPPPKARRAAAAGYRAPPAPEPHQVADDGKGTELVPHASSRGRVRGPPPPRPDRDRDVEPGGVRPTEAWVSFRRACLGGKGEVMIEGEVRDINIPVGATDGTIVMLDDTSITLRVEPHEVLEREGIDLHMELIVDGPDAERGARMLVPTLETEVTVIVPPDVQTGQQLRVGGRGIPTGKGDERGDLIVTIFVSESDLPPAGRIRLKRSDASSSRPKPKWDQPPGEGEKY